MKLTNDSMDSSKAQYVGGQPSAQKPGVGPQKIQSKGPVDSVSVGQSSTLQNLTAGQAPFDSEKVEAMKQQIKDGTFVVNSAAVADSLMAESKGLSKT